MFTTDPITGLSYFRPGSLQPLYIFELFGLLVALAAYNGITIPVNFPLALYKHLLDVPCTDLRDIQDGWPDIARSLQSIKGGAYEGLDYVFPLEANGLRMSIDHDAIDRLRAQTDDYASGKRTSLDLPVGEMSRIESGASAASTTPYQPSDHHWPGWSIRAPRTSSQISVDDGSSTPDSTASHTVPHTAAQAEQPSVLNTLTTLAKSDPKLKNLMAQVAANTATDDQLKAFSNHVNRARAIVQAEKRKGKEAVSAETEKDAPADTTKFDQEEEEEEQAPSSNSLTASSLPSYITHYTLWLTTLSVYPQLHAFKKGFHALIPPHHLSPFTPPTLSLALQGAGPNLDLPALRRATQYKDYSATEPYVQMFWRVVEKWPNEKRVALLRFVTAAERVPVVAGAGGLVFRVQRSGGHGGGQGGPSGFAGQARQGEFGGGGGGQGGQGALDLNVDEEGEAGSEGAKGEEDVQLLPTSSTCFSTLYLPRYKDEATLERKLGIALEFGGVGFGTA